MFSKRIGNRREPKGTRRPPWRYPRSETSTFQWTGFLGVLTKIRDRIPAEAHRHPYKHRVYRSQFELDNER
jgi:hypothetical protein